jgi:hypothetical protein
VNACSSSSSVERATLGNLTYDVPANWSSRDFSARDRAMLEWTPRENERKESVTVIRAERAALAKSGGTRRVERLLQEAQAKLPSGKFSAPVRFATRHGFEGVRIEGAFTPPNQTQPYQRLHAILIDGTSLLHVIYTAREADREAFETVVESFQQNRGA